VASKLKLTAVLLPLTGIFVASNIYTLIPIYENVSESLKIDENHVVLAGSLFSLFYAIGLLYFGPASDRFGRRKVITIGLFGSAISTLLVGLANDTFSLYATRSLQGLTLGSFAPVAFAYTFDLFSEKKRTLLLVFINTGFLMAGILGQLTSSSITAISTWSYVYFFFAVCYTLLFVISLIILPKTKLPTQQSRSVLSIMRDLLKNKSLVKCYGITFTLLFSFVALYDAIGRFFDGTPEELFTLRGIGLIGAVLSLFTGTLIEKFGLDRTMFTGFLIGAISLISMSLFQSLLALMILSILFVASISLLIPTVITLVGTLAGKHRAKALSLYSFVLLTGASLASPIVMFINFQLVLLLLLSFFILNIIAGLLLSKEINPLKQIAKTST
jgi:MFS family permease